jgi:hypothetical protein
MKNTSSRGQPPLDLLLRCYNWNTDTQDLLEMCRIQEMWCRERIPDIVEHILVLCFVGKTVMLLVEMLLKVVEEVQELTMVR